MILSTAIARLRQLRVNQMLTEIKLSPGWLKDFLKVRSMRHFFIKGKVCYFRLQLCFFKSNFGSRDCNCCCHK